MAGSGEDEVDVRSLAGEIEDLARQLRAEHDSEQRTLQAVVARAAALIPGAEHAAVSRVVRRGRPEVETIATTGEVPPRIDQLQYETGEGPCLDALWGSHVVRAQDLAHDQRWPAFGPKAAVGGVRSMVSYQLYVEGDEELGALNVYAARPAAFTEDSEAVGLHVAAQGSVALAAARKEEQLERVIRTRSTISAAAGMLAERYRLRPDVAFQLMVRISQERNIKVLDIAEVLTTTGRFPPTEEQAPSRD